MCCSKNNNRVKLRDGECNSVKEWNKKEVGPEVVSLSLLMDWTRFLASVATVQ